MRRRSERFISPAPPTPQTPTSRWWAAGCADPKNGGTERCLLVNVEDNVAQFGEKLAFHEFDYLWKSGADV